jgi:endonuclease/exonuclease/phosphatase family metal-dependent hydrolase
MARADTLSVITANIAADFLTPPGVPPWTERRQPYVQALRAADPAIIGMQEVTPRQFAFLQRQLADFGALTVPTANPDPTLLAAWREKYGAAGFMAPPDPYEVVLFYRRASCVLLAGGHWWLSPTPERPSVGFGNIAPRVMLWAHLLHRPSGRELIVFNTHIDRRCTAPMLELCRQRCASFAGRGLPMLLIGDLNVNPADPEYAALIAAGWHDAHAATASAEAATFLFDTPAAPAGRIDHILYRGGGIAPLEWSRLASPDSARRLSDHDPVAASFRLG